tara:strand:- start:800 stop:1744 length:945 start_codon:yes stop_codon:yes gene_type:complete
MKYLRIVLACLLLSLTATWAMADTLTGGIFTVDFHSDDRIVAEDTLAYLEEAAAEFSEHLPPGDTPIQVRIASNMNEFLGLSGTYAHVGVSGVTRADKSLIALKSPRLRSLGDDYRGTVRHELVHVLLHRNVDTTNLPRWLNEGLCMMLANELRWGSALQVARMHLSGQLVPLDRLDRVFALPGNDHQFGNAYAQALSMTRYLRDELGEERFWNVILDTREESFASAMVSKGNLSAQAFWQGYMGSLWWLTVISVLRTGSFWGAISFLCILTFLVKHWRNRKIVQRWESEEAMDEEDRPFDWDSILVDADDWKR